MRWADLVWLKQFDNEYLGGYDGSSYYDGFDDSSHYDDILEYVPRTGQWKEVANMKKARQAHAVSTINFSEVAQFCNWGVRTSQSVWWNKYKLITS